MCADMVRFVSSHVPRFLTIVTAGTFAWPTTISDKLTLSVVYRMVSLAKFSDFKNFIKSNNKIPEYARDYKKEYLFIIGLNKYFVENKDNISTYEFFHNNNIDRISKLIKIFLKRTKKG